MNPKEILQIVNQSRPDGYYTTRSGVSLPRHELFYKEMISWKKGDSSSTYCDRDERVKKTAKKISRVRMLQGLLGKRMDLGRSVRILDLGAGFGIEAMAWGRLTGASVVAVDRDTRFTDPKLVKDAAAWIESACEQLGNKGGLEGGFINTFNNNNVQWVNASASNLPFDDASFDLVFSVYSLEHFVGVEKAVKEVKRILRPGGLFYCKWANYHSLIGCHIEGLVDVPWGHVFMMPEEIIEAAGRLGMEMNEERRRIVNELNRYSLAEWKGIFDRSGLDRIHAKNFSDYQLSDLLPDWIRYSLPARLVAEELLIDDVEMIFVNGCKAS